MSIIGGINFPLEVGKVDADCTVCHDELKWPVFCPRCRHGNCFACLEHWFMIKGECPMCRHLFQLNERASLRIKYGCPQDGNLVEFYCEQCLDCFCAKCKVNVRGVHFRHSVNAVDALRNDLVEHIKKLCQTNSNNDLAQKALDKLKALMPTGSPFELVRQRRIFQSELDRLKSLTTHLASFEKKFLLTNVYGECQVFSATDPLGNVWQLTVYPNGYSDARAKFISLYLKLVSGKPARYEYQFKILDKNGQKAVESYSAIDDFTTGSLSLACQRLIHLNEARQLCLTAKGYDMIFSTKPTNPIYGVECEAALRLNKPLRLNYRKFTWTARNFTAKQAANKIEFAPIVYDQQKISWRFRIDYNGHWEQGVYVSVFLELLDGAEGWFDIVLRLYNPMSPAIEIKRQLTHKFTVHSNWGVPHFIRHSELPRFLSYDELHFEYGMRPAHVEQNM